MNLLRHSWQGFRHSWRAYAGAFVALTGGTLLIGVTVALVGAVDATAHLPGTSRGDREQLDGLASMFGIMAGVSLFMAMFVVASTFGFVVATRRRELGLLRLVGATPGQTRRLLIGEASVVAVLSALSGCLAATALTPALFAALRTMDVTTLHLVAPSGATVWAVAAPSGAAVALLGSWRASGRAARTSPTAALQEASLERRRPGVLALVVAVLCTGAVVATAVLAPSMPPLFALVVGILLPEVVVVGLMCVGGLVFPALAGLLGRSVAGRDVAARLARDHVRTSVRLPAAVAAPVVAISAIAGSMILTLSLTADWTTALDREQLTAGLVVVDAGAPDLAAIGSDPQVAVADVRRTASVGIAGATEQAEVVDVRTAAAARGLRATEGSLDGLSGRAIAVTETWTVDSGGGVGDRRVLRVDGRQVVARIVAVVPDAPDLYGDVLVPADLPGVAPVVRSTGEVFVVPRGDAGPAAAALRADLAGAGARVLTAGAWVDEVGDRTRAANNLGLWVFLGPAGLYAAIGIVNAVLIGASQRSAQLRTARLLGATPGQVRRSALWEAAMIGASGVLVGGLVTAGVGWLVRQAVVRDVPGAAFTVPWLPLGGVALACVALVLAAAAAGSRAVGRVSSVG